MPLKIIILDSYTLSPGDLPWTPFEQLGSITFYDRTPEHLILERSIDADILLTNKTPLTESTLNSLPKLKYVGVLATGHNIVDSKIAREKGITVTNVPEYSTMAVAQHTFSLLLELTQHTGHLAKSVRQGDWTKSKDFSYWEKSPIELARKTLGIIGSGKIGKAVGKIAEAMGMHVCYASKLGGDKELELVIRSSDVISLHCPLTVLTKEIISKRTIAWMKPTTLVINTSRGGLINELDLSEALNSGRIAGAGLDVLSTEPPAPNNPLLNAKNCIITPHIAWASIQARERLMYTAASNLKHYLEGNTINCINL
jgi:glycerate dehydrogenase